MSEETPGLCEWKMRTFWTLAIVTELESPTCNPPGMRKCDCQRHGSRLDDGVVEPRSMSLTVTLYVLLTYSLAMLLPPSKWPLKTSAQRILADVHLPPTQMRHKISWVTGPKFTKFVAAVTFSSTVLTQQSAMRSVHPLSNERGDI